MVIKLVIFAQFSEWENCRCIFEKPHCHEQIQFSDIHCCLFFCWHLVVTTVVGLLDILTVFNSAEWRSFLLTRCHCGCGRQNPLVGRRIECSFFPFLWACRYSWQVSTRLRIALATLSPPEICPQISQRGDCAGEGVWLVFCSATDLCFLWCLLDAAQLLWIALVDLVHIFLVSSKKSLKIPAARRPAIRNPTAVHLSLLLLHALLSPPFFGLFVGLFLSVLCAEFTTRFRLIKTDIRKDANSHGNFVQVPFKKFLHGCRLVFPDGLLPLKLLFLDALLHPGVGGSEVGPVSGVGLARS